MQLRRWARVVLPSFLFLQFLHSIAVVFGAEGGVTSGGGGVRLSNPLGADNLKTVLDNILPKLIEIAAPIVAIMVIYGAFLMLVSAGDEEKISRGRKTILYAAIGFLIILLAQSIVYIIEDVVK